MELSNIHLNEQSRFVFVFLCVFFVRTWSLCALFAPGPEVNNVTGHACCSVRLQVSQGVVWCGVEWRG